MSRSVPWRRSCPDKVSSRIQRASRARIYLLRATGPTGFLLTAEGDDRKFKVFLGDPHSCTCPVFLKEKDLCIHILWVLIKKFRVPKEDTVVFQLGLVEREIGEVVRGIFSNAETNKANNKSEEADSREKRSKKEITEDDVCPICQEDLFGQPQSTTYCKYGCGNSIHIKCMKVWAEHQKSSGESIMKCPLCRVDFGSFEVIKTEYLKSTRSRRRQDVHVGAVCAHCGMSPISGKCYRCTVCSNYQLCKECFASDPHSQHSFVSRQKPNQRWRPASKVQVIPPAAVDDLQSREITEDDYTLLLQLDGSSLSQSGVPEHVLNSFPVERIADNNHRLISKNEKCRVCFDGYKSSQVVRKLPCDHEFHRNCIDSWLSNDHNTCPIDGQTVCCPLTKRYFSRDERGTAAVSGARRSWVNPRERNMIMKKGSLAAMIKRQTELSSQQDDHLPQSLFLNGLSLLNRNTEPTLKISRGTTRVNSSTLLPDQTVRQTESSSKHLTFDARMPGRAMVSAEQVIRYGRHSGDSRLRRCMGLAERRKSESFGPKSLSMNDITLCGRKISSSEYQGSSVQGLNKNDPSIISTPLVTSSPNTGFDHVPVDI